MKFSSSSDKCKAEVGEVTKRLAEVRQTIAGRRTEAVLPEEINALIHPLP